MEQLLIQSNAQEHFLQASSREVNILIPFSGEPMEVCTAQGNGAELEALNTTVQDLAPGGGTDMYAAAPPGAGGAEKLRPGPSTPPAPVSC